MKKEGHRTSQNYILEIKPKTGIRKSNILQENEPLPRIVKDSIRDTLKKCLAEEQSK